MNLVLNAIGASVDNNIICSLLPDKEVEIVDTSNMKIAHCMGCNQSKALVVIDIQNDITKHYRDIVII